MKYIVICTTLFLARKKPHKSGDIISESDFGGESGVREKNIAMRLNGGYIREATPEEIAKSEGREAETVVPDLVPDLGKQGDKGTDSSEGGAPETPETPEDEVSSEDLSRKEIRAELDTLNVSYDKKAPTKDLFDLLLKSRK